MSDRYDVLVFTEASPQIGHGHVVRCLALAEECEQRGLSTAFATQDRYTAELVNSLGGEVLATTPTRPPAYVIRDFRDGSAAEAVLEHREQGARVLLLDDLTSARTVADVVSDCLMTADRAAQYPHAEGVIYLYGLNYAPLRREFREARATHDPAGPTGSRLLICLGGSDTLGIAPRFLDALHREGYRGPATIIVDEAHTLAVTSSIADWQDAVVATRMRDMSAVVSEAALVVTKLGLTVLESFCLSTACVLIEPSWKHLELSRRLEANYPGWPAMELGLESSTDFGEAARKAMALLADSERLKGMGATGAQLVDGYGTARLIDALVADNE